MVGDHRLKAKCGTVHKARCRIFVGMLPALPDAGENEEVDAKKLLMKPFLKPYLKKQQAQYIADLKKALG